MPQLLPARRLACHRYDDNCYRSQVLLREEIRIVLEERTFDRELLRETLRNNLDAVAGDACPGEARLRIECARASETVSPVAR